MNNTKPYIDYTFTGMRPFIKTLYELGVAYEILADEDAAKLLENRDDIINKKSDCVTLGLCQKEDSCFHFLELGIVLADDIRTYITFIYKDKPSLKDMNLSLDDIGTLTVEKLQKFKEENLEKFYQ